MATGNIVERKRSSGEIRYEITVEGERDLLTGKRNRVYKTVNGSKKEARALMRQMMVDMDRGVAMRKLPKKISEWLDEWLELYLPNIEETTRIGYKTKINNYIKPALGDILLQSLRAEHVQKMVNDMIARGLSPKNIPTMRDQIRADIMAISNFELTLKNFYRRMRDLGYTFEYRGEYLRIKPYGSNKFFRMDKLGAEYTEEGIKARIIRNAQEYSWVKVQYYKPTLQEKPKGLRALYLHYLYLLGAIPKVIPKNPEAYAAIKDDIRRARMYSEQAKFLGKYGLETKDNLINHALKIDPQIKALCNERRALWNKIRWAKDPEQERATRDKIFAISAEIKTLRKEFAMCKDVYDRSASVERTVMLIEFPQLLEQEKQKSAPKKDGREDR